MKPIIQQFQDDIRTVIDKYRDQGISIGETIGAIEMIKLDLYTEQVGDDEEQQW